MKHLINKTQFESNEMEKVMVNVITILNTLFFVCILNKYG
jgi:preprotein translocase subunit SecG